VDSFSPIILGDSSPTAVILQGFTARPAGSENGFALPLTLVAVGAVGGVLVLRRRRKS
jgi:hypothetical protein